MNNPSASIVPPVRRQLTALAGTVGASTNGMRKVNIPRSEVGQIDTGHRPAA